MSPRSRGEFEMVAVGVVAVRGGRRVRTRADAQPASLAGAKSYREAMPSCNSVLDRVRLRPGIYVGGSDCERGAQLAGLEMLIAGYALAVLDHGVKDDGLASYGEFPAYLRARFGWSMSCGPIAAIRETSSNDGEAWERFWHLLDEYKKSRAERVDP